VNSAIIQVSRDTLSSHARSFKWAAFFLPPDRRDDAALLYTLCRLIDDMADEAPNVETARAQLGALRNLLEGGESQGLVEAETVAVVQAFNEMALRRGVDVSGVFELIEGVESDLGNVAFKDDVELLRYCYRVAGVVGLLMCPILGVTDSNAKAHAIDLGVGMQLTNICRDVSEDAVRRRVYLPSDRLERHGVTSQEILDGTANVEGVSAVVSELLEMAERYYESAGLGMDYIPARSRLAILVASRLYRGIGVKLLQRGGNPFEGRVWVSSLAKMGWILNALAFFFARALRQGVSPRHDSRLHAPLRGLPGVQTG